MLFLEFSNYKMYVSNSVTCPLGQEYNMTFISKTISKKLFLI